MYFYCSETTLFDIGDSDNFYCERCACIIFRKEIFKYNKVTIHQLIAVEENNYRCDTLYCFICNKNLTDSQNITNLNNYCDQCDEEKYRIIHLLDIKSEIIEKNTCVNSCTCIDCRIAHNFICEECNQIQPNLIETINEE